MVVATQVAQATDVRSNRVVVLVSPAEKQRIAADAAAADMSISDFMRTAAEGFTEPTPSERRLMHDLLQTLEEANARTDASLARLMETQARAASFDEDAYREQVRAELEAREDIDWAVIAAGLGLGRA